MKLTEREADVLNVIKARGQIGRITPTIIARLLNPPLSSAACEWCPVGPPKPGEQCATVKTSVRWKVESALRTLLKKGLIVRTFPGTRWASFAVV